MNEQIKRIGTSLVVQWLRFCPSAAGGMGSISTRQSKEQTNKKSCEGILKSQQSVCQYVMGTKEMHYSVVPKNRCFLRATLTTL